MNDTIPMPSELIGKIYNSNEPCDVLQGACACGAWHDLDDWVIDSEG